MTRVRSGAYNARWPLTPGQQMRDVRRMMAGANVLAVSEMQRDLAAHAQKAGFGVYMNKSGYDSAVVWDRAKYRMLDSSTTRLNDNATTYGGRANVRHAAAVLLQDRATGEQFWQVSTHLAPKKTGTKAQQMRVQAEQMIALTRLVHKLAKDGNPVILGGDFNRAGAHVNGMTNAARTDVMYTMSSGARALKSKTLYGGRGGGQRSLRSDHGGIVTSFRLGHGTPAGGGTGGNGNGGNGNGGNGNGDGGGPVVTDESAFALLENLFESWGLPMGGDIEHIIHQAMLDGITPDKIDQIMPQLQATQTWKIRFAGNEILKQNGQSVLSVPEYLAVERSYSQILKNYGLPKGFYDDPSDYAKWIGNQVSANELQQRASMFADVAKREDPAVTEQLASMGLSQGDIMAFIMDPTKAEPLIQRKYQTTILGAAARRSGVVANNDYLGHLSDIGVSEQQASQGYGVVGEGLSTMQTLGDVYGEQFGQSDFEAEVFDQNAEAAKKRKRLASRERANFSGQSGVGQASLSRPTGGSY